MQLMFFLLLFLLGGKPENFKKVKPILENIGGDGIADMLKEAEQVESVLTAVKDLTAAGKGNPFGGNPAQSDEPLGDNFAHGGGKNFPLAPISEIADDGILRCLSSYVALGE